MKAFVTENLENLERLADGYRWRAALDLDRLAKKYGLINFKYTNGVPEYVSSDLGTWSGLPLVTNQDKCKKFFNEGRKNFLRMQMNKASRNKYAEYDMEGDFGNNSVHVTIVKRRIKVLK